MRNRFVIVGFLGTTLVAACGSSGLSKGGTSDGAIATNGAAGAGADAPFTPDSASDVRGTGTDAGTADVSSTGGAAGTGGTAGRGTGGVLGSDARAATGGVAGSDGPTTTGGGGITDGPVATGGAGGSDAPVATGGTGSGGIGGANDAAGAAGSRGRVGTTGGTGGGRSTVVRVPAINSFTASPATIGAGQSSTLSWAVIAATTLSIDQGVGSVLGTYSLVVTPKQTTTYTLTLDGTMSAQVTVTVVPAGFWATGSMTAARTHHTATLLPSGKSSSRAEAPRHTAAALRARSCTTQRPGHSQPPAA